MEQENFKYLAESILKQSPSGSGQIIPGWDHTNDGLLVLSLDDSVAKVGFGIASTLTPSAELLTAIARINATMNYGHYWLAEGADNSNWQLVAGFKLPYSIVDTDYAGNLLAGLVRSHHVIQNTVIENLGTIPHRRYWPDADPEQASARSLVLGGHIAG